MRGRVCRCLRVIGWPAGFCGSLASQAQTPGACPAATGIIVLRSQGALLLLQRLDTLRLATVKLRDRPEAPDQADFS
jgi:hypothetical protein